jgi:Carboxypeptidase regulatory-like domain
MKPDRVAFKSRSGLRTFAVFTVLAAMLRIAAVAQVVTGSVSGSVVDPTRAVVPGAAVTLTDEGTGAAAKANTSGSGTFRFTLLPIGRYDLEISKSGFSTLKLSGIQVDANVEHTLGTLALQVGQTNISVEVSAAPPLVEGAQAQITTALNSQAVQTFAGTGENEGLDFLALTLPGVGNSRDNNFSNTNGVGFSVNGIRGRNNDQQIDGQNNNDNSVAGPGLFLSDPDFVNEYQVTTSNFGPEYGRNSGSVVNIVTKSGTNRWHGTIFGTETNSVLTSLTNIEKDFSTPPITKPPRFNQEFSGGTIGGPLVKDRVFIFGGFDNQIDSSKAVFPTGELTPTALGIAQLSTCFPGSTSIAALSAYGPYGVGAGSPSVSGTPTTAYFDGAPVNNGVDPATGKAACGYQLAGVQRTLPNGFHVFDFITRLDVHVSDSDSFNIRYLFQKQNFFNANEGPGNIASGYPFNVPSLGQSFLADWTHTFSNRMLNELRLGYSRNNVEFGTNTLGTVPSQSEVGSALTNVSFTNAALLGFGPPTNIPQGRIVNTYQLQDNFDYNLGVHQLKWGANITNQRSPNVFLPNYNGAYVYSDWGAYAANTPSSVSVTSGDPKYGFREWDTFLYVGDDWKVKRNLTLNLGLTWSYLGQPANLFHQETVNQQTSHNPFWDPSLPLSATTSPSIGTVKDLFGPSAGFAWSPISKTVLRGGYRLTYDPAYYNTFLLNAISAPVVLAQTLISPTAGLPAAPYGPAIRSLYASSLTYGKYDPRNFDRTVTPTTFRPDKYHEWSLGIQREITKDSALEVRYVGNHGEDGFQSINVNPYIAGLAASYPNLVPAGLTPCTKPLPTVPSAMGRISCSAGVTDETANTGFSNYDALQAEFRTTNIFHQLTLRTSYTFSKTLDNVSEIFSTFGAANSVAYSQNVLNYTGQEYGISGLDYPNTWTLSFVEDIPFMRSQPGVLGHIVGGWQVSGTYLLQSGQPYTPSQEFINVASGGVANDTDFDLANIGTLETSRPFLGSSSAPVTQVGIYAADACNALGAACGTAKATLISLNALNASSTVTPVSKSQVRLIANGGEADAIFGTPFGNAGRNILRDYHTNVGNFTLFKNIKFWERTTLQFHMTMNNVFNHPNYGNTIPGISPFIENAGVPGAYTTFGDPRVTSTAINSCPAGSRCIFFGLKVSF